MVVFGAWIVTDKNVKLDVVVEDVILNEMSFLEIGKNNIIRAIQVF